MFRSSVRALALVTIFTGVFAANAAPYDSRALHRLALNFRQEANLFQNNLSMQMHMGMMPAGNIPLLANTLSTQANNFCGQIYGAQPHIQSALQMMRTTYFALQQEAQGSSLMYGPLGGQLMNLGNLLQQMGYYVMSDNGGWDYGSWRGGHHGWWNDHHGYGHGGGRRGGGRHFGR